MARDLINELSKVRVCAGKRFSCSYYTITQQGLQPNKKGNYVDCVPTNFAEVLMNMQNGFYTKECKTEADKYNKNHPDDIRELKHYAHSIYAFKDHRYVVEEKLFDENGKQTGMLRTNDAYNHWTGFKGFDFDPPKEKFTKEQREEIGITFKRILYDELNEYHWFIGSGLSTGGHGTHCYTASKLPELYYELSLEEKIRYHDIYFWNLFLKMVPCLTKLVNTLDYMTLEDAEEMLDDAMLKVGQTLNITPLDNDPYINGNFTYEEVDILSFFNSTDKDYPVYSDNDYLLLSDTEKQNYKIFIDVCIGNEVKLTKHYKNNKPTNVIINECTDFDIHKLDNCKGPWHFEHKRKDNKFWTGNQVIHTLSFFFTKNTIKAIWQHPKFYDEDPKDWIRFVDDNRWGSDSYLPNFRLINWLNKNCNMNLQYDLEEKDDATHITLKDNEFIYDKKDELYKALKPGINLIESGTGTGKTTYVNKTFDDIFNNESNPLYNGKHQNIIITEPYKSVIKTKFQKQSDKGIVDIIVGSKRIKLLENNSNNVCTIYYHLNLISEAEIEKVDLLIIDESHLLFSEAYRFGCISEFIHKINMFKQVILMTGTPIYEHIFFNNCNRIVFDKKDLRYITHEFIRFEPTIEIQTFNITVLSEFVRTLVKNNKKVFIYDKDISLQNCKRFQAVNNDLKIAIYHKKHADEPSNTEDMIYIDEHHNLGDKYDVIISSCYFSVGNDLYDKGKAAVIMCGIHIPSEIIQVDGRWRNMSEINIYTIIKNKREEICGELDFNKLYKHKKEEILRIKNDCTIRDNSLAISKKFFEMVKNANDEDIELLAYMETLEVHQKTIDYINNELGKYDIWCDDRIMPLAYNFDYIEKNKEFSKELKNIRSDFREDLIEKLLKNEEFEWMNTDNKLEVWQRTVYIMFKHVPLSLFKEGIYWIKCISCTSSMKLFNKLNERIYKDKIDYSEIYAMVKTSEKLISKDKKINEWLSFNTYECIKGYVLFATRHNKDKVNREMIQYNYFKEFMNMCIDYCSIPDIFKEYLFTSEGLTNPIFSVDNNEWEVNINKLSIDEYENNFERNKNKATLKNIEIILFNDLLTIIKYKYNNPYKFGGEIGSPKKECLITYKMKPVLLEKYNLQVGQEFESMTALAKYVNKSPKCITEWKNKGWIIKR